MPRIKTIALTIREAIMVDYPGEIIRTIVQSTSARIVLVVV